MEAMQVKVRTFDYLQEHLRAVEAQLTSEQRKCQALQASVEQQKRLHHRTHAVAGQPQPQQPQQRQLQSQQKYRDFRAATAWLEGGETDNESDHNSTASDELGLSTQSASASASMSASARRARAGSSGRTDAAEAFLAAAAVNMAAVRAARRSSCKDVGSQLPQHYQQPRQRQRQRPAPVSYTHLTLPTIYSV